MQEAFDLSVEKTAEALKKQGFEQSKDFEDDLGPAVLFVNKDAAYSIVFKTNDNMFELRSTNMTDDGPNSSWKSVSNWIFDLEQDTLREAEAIATDFIETVEGPSRLEEIKKAQRQAFKDDDNNPGPLFFFKRLVNIFPDLKEQINEERTSYVGFRSVTFAKEFIVPKVENLAIKKKESAAFKKMCELLNEFYKNGDLDVRSIITMVILNGLSDTAVQNIMEQADPMLKKGYKYGVKWKGKKAKPEREKLKDRRGSRSSSEAPKRL